MAGSEALAGPVLRPLAERLAAHLAPLHGPAADLPARGAELAAALGAAGAHPVIALAPSPLPRRTGVLTVRGHPHPAPLRPGSLALAAALLSLHDHPDPAAALRAMATAVAPGGRLVVAAWAAGGAPHLAALGEALHAARGSRPPGLDRELAFDPGAAVAASGLQPDSDAELADVVRFHGVAHLLGCHDGVVDTAVLTPGQVPALLDDLGTRLLAVTAWDGTLIVPVRLRVVTVRAR